MGVALITFVLTLVVIVGTYWVLVARPEARTAERLRQRIQLKSERPVGSASVVKGGQTEVAGTGPLARLRHWHRQYAVTAAARLLESAGMRTDPQWLVGGTALMLVFVVSALRATEAGWRVALAAAVLTPLVPYLYIKHLARRRLARFEEVFPDAISLMARALRAGHALTSTLAAVADEVPEPVKSEFRALHHQHNYGLPLQQVLRTFATRVPLIDVRFFVTAVLTQRGTGGNLAEVLDNLATVMRDRFRVRRQLRVLTAQGRMTGWVLGAVPIVVALGMYLVNPAQMSDFATDPLGVRLLQAAIALEIVGVAAIRKIVTLDY
jgi:tight adherence protein B